MTYLVKMVIFHSFYFKVPVSLRVLSHSVEVVSDLCWFCTGGSSICLYSKRLIQYMIIISFGNSNIIYRTSSTGYCHNIGNIHIYIYMCVISKDVGIWFMWYTQCHVYHQHSITMAWWVLCLPSPNDSCLLCFPHYIIDITYIPYCHTYLMILMGI